MEYYLPLIFFLIALFYSSVGFGGGSSYLAILSLVLTDFYEIRSMALVLNICVVTIGTFIFIKNKVFSLKQFWPFLVMSIPFAYLGASVKLSQKGFFLVLGSALILAGIFMMLRFILKQIEAKEFSNTKKLALGGAIGLLSGISGIGGGIFLSPVLNLMKWGNPRIVAALASVFILVNSAAGLFGLFMAGTFHLNRQLIVFLVVAVIVGGSIGSYLSNKKFNLKFLGILTSVLVLYVGFRLILLHGFGIKI
ncbi:sulfite exporter TauE/SafE family protein [Robertkochia solimangrovi]|uniref:sulfite exporter TauE/SafE family protein n=1 Tax=Robertkochia solimangrovi TaxID=2213046 RepID=UPI0011804F3F|nr:sulfite exporter TauE/SafE family protein [Robertkochia solimangrovi]TRZ42225.1 sulfite exporter TauE/SafE family protein [Robertkochia solimangrovi]